MSAQAETSTWAPSVTGRVPAAVGSSVAMSQRVASAGSARTLAPPALTAPLRAAPLATVDVNVDLPGSTATPAPRPETPLFLTLKDDLTLAIGNDSVPRPVFAAMLDSGTKGDKQTRIFLRADKAVAYGDLMEAMNLLRRAGYLKIALVGLEAAPAATGAAAP